MEMVFENGSVGGADVELSYVNEVSSVDMAPASERISVLEERVSNHIKFFWAVVVVGVGWLGWISVQLYQIHNSVGPLIASHELSRAANFPLDAKSQSEVLKVITKAKQSQVPIPTPVLAEAGKSFVAASARDPKAWETVKILMEYRTNVNSLTFVFPATNRAPDNTKFGVKVVPGKPQPQMSYVPSGVPIGDAARFQEIGKPTNEGVGLGPSHLILSDGAASLDGMDIAHVVFVGVEVHYSGSETRLEDILFVNCSFVFDNSERGRMLAENIIASRNVNFPS